MTVDGGSTYTDITSQINGSTWTRVQVSQAAVTNPNVGFRIVTSGDAIYVDYFGLESATFASSRIATTTTAVTRNATVGNYPVTDNMPTNNAQIQLEWTPLQAGMGTVYLWGSYVDANNSTSILHDGTNVIFRKRIGGTNYDSTKALTYTAGTTYTVKATASDSAGIMIAVGGVDGTGHANTTAMQLGPAFGVGTNGNGGGQASSAIRNLEHRTL